MKAVLFFLLLSAFVPYPNSSAIAQNAGQYVFDKKIPIPGNGGYDYLFIDAASRRIFISHGNTVHIIDLDTEKTLGVIDNLVGVHGIAIASEFNKGFISDGKGNTVVVFDLKSLKTIKTISITGKDPDAIMYDPFSKRIFTFNGDSGDASVIDASSLTQIGTVAVGGTPEFAVSNGQGKIFNNLEDKSILNIIDPLTLKVVSTYPLDPCGGPTGLALDKNDQRLFTVCRKNKGMTVLDAQTGKIITTVSIGAGVDAVVYDPDTKLVFCSNGDGTATIIRQESPDKYTVVQTLETQWRAKTMALDPKTKKIYFSAFDMEPGNKTRIPDTFKLLIFKPGS